MILTKNVLLNYILKNRNIQMNFVLDNGLLANANVSIEFVDVWQN